CRVPPELAAIAEQPNCREVRRRDLHPSPPKSRPCLAAKQSLQRARPAISSGMPQSVQEEDAPFTAGATPALTAGVLTLGGGGGCGGKVGPRSRKSPFASGALGTSQAPAQCICSRAIRSRRCAANAIRQASHRLLPIGGIEHVSYSSLVLHRPRHRVTTEPP